MWKFNSLILMSYFKINRLNKTCIVFIWQSQTALLWKYLGVQVVILNVPVLIPRDSSVPKPSENSFVEWNSHARNLWRLLNPKSFFFFFLFSSNSPRNSLLCLTKCIQSRTWKGSAPVCNSVTPRPKLVLNFLKKHSWFFNKNLLVISTLAWAYILVCQNKNKN